MPRPPPPEVDADHCPRCFLRHEICLCEAIPTLRTCCRVLVVRHWVESWRATNTGRLVHRAVEGTVLVDHGRPGFVLEQGDLPLVDGACLLFPETDSAAPPWTGGCPELLVVVDGTWSQARRMVRRVPGLAQLPRLSLPPGAEPPRRIRRSPFPGARSTIEAVAAALSLWEPPETGRALLDLYEVLAQRMDLARGPRWVR